MTPKEERIAELVESLYATQAEAGKFGDIAAAINAETVELPPATVSMADTLAALGDDANQAIAAFEVSPVGRQGLAKLAATGLNYGHAITRALIASMVSGGHITQKTADTLISLSVTTVSAAAHYGLHDLSAADVKDAWSAKTLKATVEDVRQRLDALYNAARAGDAEALATINSLPEVLA